MSSSSGVVVDIAPLCVIWSQMRVIRILIQQRRIGEPIDVYAKSFPAAAASLAASLIAIVIPSWFSFLAVTLSTLVYNWQLAPYEVDNGASIAVQKTMETYTMCAPLHSPSRNTRSATTENN